MWLNARAPPICPPIVPSIGWNWDKKSNNFLTGAKGVEDGYWTWSLEAIGDDSQLEQETQETIILLAFMVSLNRKINGELLGFHWKWHSNRELKPMTIIVENKKLRREIRLRYNNWFVKIKPKQPPLTGDQFSSWTICTSKEESEWTEYWLKL